MPLTIEEAREAKCKVCNKSLWKEGAYTQLQSYWFSDLVENIEPNGYVDMVWYRYNTKSGHNLCGLCCADQIDEAHKKDIRICEVSPA